MASLVQKGDSIYIPANALGGCGAKKVTVSWTQSFSAKSDTYWACNYTVEAGGLSKKASGVVFVQESKAGDFKAKKKAGETEITLQLDDSFQYGQNKAQTNRFLVFHNKDNKIYQHRLVEAVYNSLGNQEREILEGLGLPRFSERHEIIRDFIGDYLRNF